MESSQPYASPRRRMVAPKKKTKSRGATRGQLTRRQEIDRVLVEETFPLQWPPAVAVDGGDRHVGEGGYISTTWHNRRYYGLLIDQASLKAASLLYFQEEAAGTDLDQKIAAAWQRQQPQFSKRGFDNDEDDDEEKESSQKRRWETDEVPSSGGKRARREGTVPDAAGSMVLRTGTSPAPPRAVQKFRLVATNGATGGGYRVLLATYVDVAAAAEDDPELHHAIEVACRSGGDFVGPYYYHYEVRARVV
jgi:hypothetical protein